MKHFFQKVKSIIIQTGIIILISFLLGEITFRIYNYFSPTFIFYTDSYNRYRGKPFSTSWDFKLNSRGFNDNEFPKKREHAYRILGIGDSFAFGAVPHKYNYLTILKSQLREDNKNVEVLNMGIPGIVPIEYLSLFVREGLELKPDMLLLSFFIGNDFLDCGRKRKLYSYSYVASLVNYLLSVKSKFEGNIIHGKEDYCDDCPNMNKETYRQIEGEKIFIYLEGNERFIKLLDKALYYLSSINDICKKHDIEFIVAIIPDEVQINRSLRHEVIKTYYPLLDKAKWNITLPNKMLIDGLDKLGIN